MQIDVSLVRARRDASPYAPLKLFIFGRDDST